MRRGWLIALCLVAAPLLARAGCPPNKNCETSAPPPRVAAPRPPPAPMMAPQQRASQMQRAPVPSPQSGSRSIQGPPSAVGGSRGSGSRDQRDESRGRAPASAGRGDEPPSPSDAERASGRPIPSGGGQNGAYGEHRRPGQAGDLGSAGAREGRYVASRPFGESERRNQAARANAARLARSTAGAHRAELSARTSRAAHLRPPRDRHGRIFFYHGRSHVRFMVGRYRWPRGHGYHRYRVGTYLPAIYWSPDYFIEDYAYYGLAAPPPDAAWLRYGPDLLLIDLATGEILQIVPDVFDDDGGYAGYDASGPPPPGDLR